MGDGLNTDEHKCIKMGATSNPDASRLAALYERKKTLEGTIAKRNQELRELCIKEAELTGITPSEFSAETIKEPSATPSTKVGARYQLPQNLLTSINSEDESLEIQIQLHLNMAEAALRLANDTNLSKTIRKQHYGYYKQQYSLLQQKKELANQQTQPKPKKKPRGPDHEDAVSMNITTDMSEHNFGKSALRHSMRSLQHPLKNAESHEHRFSSQPKLTYRKSDDNLYIENAHMKHEDVLLASFQKLNLGKYDHHDTSSPQVHSVVQPSYCAQFSYMQYPYPKSPTVVHHGSPQVISPSSSTTYHPQDYPYKSTSSQILKSMMSNTVPKSQKLNYQGYAAGQYSYGSSFGDDHVSNNPLQIQPHQQYEHDVMPSGLGGHWKMRGNGELIWCHNSSIDNVWQRDKRCGSLDRRKNKRLHKRISPNVDQKSATLSSAPLHSEINRQSIMPVQQNTFHSRQDNCQLVRTQSLGSVGVHTLDNVYPSDDNSSYSSDTYSFNDTSTLSRKQKQKEWYETSLDDVPIIPSTPKTTPRSLSTIPSILPDVKYTDVPHVSKPVLEIPAESNPSPKVPEANVELFNNNIPKNCTIVLAGHCKPYHEETKPFEMSDFYKYSTKFKNTPGKSQQNDQNMNSLKAASNVVSPQNYDDNVKGNITVTHKGVYQPLQPMKCQPYSPINSPNMGHAVGSMGNMNQDTIDNYSHMDNWYQSEDQTDNSSGERSRSTATLV